MYKVKNIGNTLQVLYDKGGKKVSIDKGETKSMINPPEDSYQFKVTKTEEKQEEPEEDIELKGRKK